MRLWAFVLLFPLALLADSTTLQRGVHLVINAHQQLDCDTVQVEIPELSADDLDRGEIILENAIQIYVSSNSDWLLTLERRSPWTELRTQRTIEGPAVQWRVREQSAWRSLRESTEIVANDKKPAKRRYIPIDLRILVNWDNCPPGEWETAVIAELERDR